MMERIEPCAAGVEVTLSEVVVEVTLAEVVAVVVGAEVTAALAAAGVDVVEDATTVLETAGGGEHTGS